MVTGNEVTMLGHQMPTRHIYEFLGLPYSLPFAPTDISDSAEPQREPLAAPPTTSIGPSWPANYVH